MKRLFGLIGLTYLSVLAVAFYFYSSFVLAVIITASLALAVIWAVLLIIKKKKKLRRTLAIISFTAMCAGFAMIIYTNFCYEPIVNKYSDKEVDCVGYICDEIIKTESSAKYIFKTESVDGEDEEIKIEFISYTDLNAYEFDVVNLHCRLYSSGSGSLLSDGIFFKSSVDDNFSIEKADRKHFSFYSYAVSIRKAMKNSLDVLLPNDYSSLCNAVLLGEKLILPKHIYSGFRKTGSSFLIVVSGMHMAVIVSVALFLIKKFTKSKLINFLVISAFVFMFMAVTGFTPSVVRSGIMIIISYSAPIFFRTSDSLNSLGIAALILLIPNPYAAGDIGLIFSFTATFGIILWSGKIYNTIVSKLELKSKPVKSFVRLTAASLSASIWVMPLSAIYFGTVSPLVLFVSLLVQTAVEILIVCSLFASVLYMLPFISFLSYPFALICGLMSKYIIFVISLFAEIPFSSVNADKPYFYIWIAATAVLVIFGYVLKDVKLYVPIAVSLSFIILVTGSTVYMLITKDKVSVNIYGVQDGMTVAVKSRDNVSILSCGGNARNTQRIIEDISRDYSSVDYLIVPNQKYKYSRYQYDIAAEFDCSNILVYDNGSTDFKAVSDYDGQSRQSFGNNMQFTLSLCKNMTDTVLCIDGVVYQLLESKNTRVLITEGGADISKLPKDFRNADFVVVDSVPSNSELLDCEQIIYAGSNENYKNDYNSLSELNKSLYNTDNNGLIIETEEGKLCRK